MTVIFFKSITFALFPLKWIVLHYPHLVLLASNRNIIYFDYNEKVFALVIFDIFFLKFRNNILYCN